MTRGVAYVALGANAVREAKASVTSLWKHNKLPVRILKQPLKGSEGFKVNQQAHWAKTSADIWSPFEPTLLLDADTRVKGDLSIGFAILEAGWELVMVPSFPTGPGQVLWILKPKELAATKQDIGDWRHIMLNTGVMFFKKTSNVAALFEAWRKEWLRFKEVDQGAFLRALRKCPVRLWLLGAPYNSDGGEVIDHRFGRAK